MIDTVGRGLELTRNPPGRSLLHERADEEWWHRRFAERDLDSLS